MSDHTRESDLPLKALHHHLQVHGHAFQHRIVDETRRIFEDGVGRPWTFETAEHPVYQAHIDFVLRHECDGTSYLLVAECKKTNPAFSKWVFLETPYVRHGDRGYSFVAEGIAKRADRTYRAPQGIEWGDHRSYNHASELKTSTAGHSCTEGKGALQKAIEQVLRGTHGLARMLRDRPGHLTTRTTVVVPIIFTTADLYAGSLDLKLVELDTGSVDEKAASISPVPYLLHSHGASPDLQGDLLPVTTGLHGLPHLLDAEFYRTIIIVQARHVNDFFSRFSPISTPLPGIVLPPG